MVATITSKGQVTIPAPLRKQLNLKTGDSVDFILADNEIVEKLLLASNIEVQHSDCVWRALREYKRGTADFSEYLIAQLNFYCGSTHTLTFDRAAAKSRYHKLAE